MSDQFNTNNTNLSFFYCYSKRVSDYIQSRNIHPITVAIEPKSKRLFSMYLQTDELCQALQDYKKR